MAGSSVGSTDEALLQDRRILRDEGFVTVIVAVDASRGKVAQDPEILSRGVAEGDETFRRVGPVLVKAVEEAIGKGVVDPYQLQQIVRRTVGSYVGDRLRRRPMIIPVVIEV